MEAEKIFDALQGHTGIYIVDRETMITYYAKPDCSSNIL